MREITKKRLKVLAQASESVDEAEKCGPMEIKRAKELLSTALKAMLVLQSQTVSELEEQGDRIAKLEARVEKLEAHHE